MDTVDSCILQLPILDCHSPTMYSMSRLRPPPFAIGRVCGVVDVHGIVVVHAADTRGIITSKREERGRRASPCIQPRIFPTREKDMILKCTRQPPQTTGQMKQGIDGLTSSSHSTDLTTPTCPCCHVCDSSQGALGSLKVERANSATSPLPTR